jgi:hypothetical protein
MMGDKEYCTERRAAARDWINEYKHTHPCEICGEADIRCLQFHHKDPSEKRFLLSGNQSLDLTKIKEEISKCRIMCANCHAKETFDRGQNSGKHKNEHKNKYNGADVFGEF